MLFQSTQPFVAALQFKVDTFQVDGRSHLSIFRSTGENPFPLLFPTYILQNVPPKHEVIPRAQQSLTWIISYDCKVTTIQKQITKKYCVGEPTFIKCFLAPGPVLTILCIILIIAHEVVYTKGLNQI